MAEMENTKENTCKKIQWKILWKKDNKSRWNSETVAESGEQN